MAKKKTERRSGKPGGGGHDWAVTRLRPRNPQDATVRNAKASLSRDRATNARVTALLGRLRKLEGRVRRLERGGYR